MPKSTPTTFLVDPVLPDFSLPLLLRGIREHHGYSQHSFAIVLGYDRSEISRWEHGIRVPSGEALADYITVCDLDWQQSEALIAAWQATRIHIRS